MVYKDRLETNSSQLFAHPENSECCLSSLIIFEVYIVAEQEQAYLVMILFFEFPLPSTLVLPLP